MPPANQNAKYTAVRGLTRGIELLHALNRAPSGRATSGELSKVTGLHRTTVRRMLETLVDDGYLRRSESDDSFRLTRKVRELSEGYTDSEWVSAQAAPLMGALLQRLVWPSDLSTPSGDAMQIRETTHRFSPLSFHGSMVGRHLPFLLTASGRAYFGHCADEEREQLLQVLRAGGGEQARLAADDRFVANLVRRVRTDGFGSNEAEWKDEKKLGAIAMPIIFEQRVLASLSVVYLASAITLEQAVARYRAPLQEAVAQIAIGLREQTPGDSMQAA
jgi:IclR family mhp operon transcriptional activator